MYLQIEDPSEVPLPPEDVRIKAVNFQPYPDRRRVRLTLKLTPFQTPPNIALTVMDAREKEVSSLSVIGATEATMSLTIHIRDPKAKEPLRVLLVVGYEEQGTVDEREETLMLGEGE
ncbi:MAG: hypothetical protein PVG02_04050 [Anaerolineales bacterium]|jgi:hypothetical protein